MWLLTVASIALEPVLGWAIGRAIGPQESCLTAKFSENFPGQCEVLNRNDLLDQTVRMPLRDCGSYAGRQRQLQEMAKASRTAG